MKRLFESWRGFVGEGRETSTIEDLKQKSETFRAIWDRMEANLEGTSHHSGESTAEHTRRVLRSMERLAAELPDAERNLMQMLAILHDIGKPDTRSEKDGNVHFYGHAKASKKLAEKILDEIAFEQKDVLLALIGRHMDIYQGFDSGDAKYLAKDKVYPHLVRLAMMTRADLESIDSPQADMLDDLIGQAKEREGKWRRRQKRKKRNWPQIRQ